MEINDSVLSTRRFFNILNIKKVSSEVGKSASLALGVTEGEAAPDWSAWEASC